MPNINLRLSEEEHEALRTWAFEGHRSIQREIIFRLFSERSEDLRVVNNAGQLIATVPTNVGAGTIQPAADSPDPHFRPDPK